MKAYPPGFLILDPQYVAGFFDGEGSVMLSFGKRAHSKRKSLHLVCTFNFTISISNTNYIILEKLHSIYGGHISVHGTSQGRKNAWQWRLNNVPEQMAFLSSVQPFCLVKKEQVKLGLEYLETCVKKGQRLTQEQWDERIRIHSRMREINCRGTSGIKPIKHPIPPAVRARFSPSLEYSKEELAAKMAAMRAAR